MVFSVRYCFLFSCQCNLSSVSFKRKRELELRFNDDIALFIQIADRNADLKMLFCCMSNQAPAPLKKYRYSPYGFPKFSLSIVI